MTLMWPMQVLRPRVVAFDIAPRSLAGPSSVSGFGQVVASDAGLWKATLGEILVHNRQERLAFRAIATLLEGRLNPILIPLCRGDQPVPDGAVDAGLYGTVPHDDGTTFDDGSEYSGTVIDVVAASNAAVRAVSMTVTVNYAGDIQSGQNFSISERLYRVRTFDPDTNELTFRPPLREAVTIGDRLEFDNPQVRMRLASDAEMDLELQMRRNGSPTVNLIEDI